MQFSHPEFPRSFEQPFIRTSDKTRRYNCIAWAMDDTTQWYWPHEDSFWPDEVPMVVELQAFITLFESHGYECCENGDLEEGYLKVAIFVNGADKPTHAARQLISGYWTSKLGRNIDVSHSIYSMENSAYGKVGQYLRKPN